MISAVLEELIYIYEGIGYPCFRVSAKKNQNIDQLGTASGKNNAFLRPL